MAKNLYLPLLLFLALSPTLMAGLNFLQTLTYEITKLHTELDISGELSPEKIGTGLNRVGILQRGTGERTATDIIGEWQRLKLIERQEIENLILYP
jgi:hypothetical protein